MFLHTGSGVLKYFLDNKAARKLVNISPCQQKYIVRHHFGREGALQYATLPMKQDYHLANATATATLLAHPDRYING